MEDAHFCFSKTNTYTSLNVQINVILKESTWMIDIKHFPNQRAVSGNNRKDSKTFSNR